MLLLASAFFLTLLQCSNAQTKTSITPADCNTAEQDAGVALDLVNKHRRDGYVFGLFRVADAHEQRIGNTSILYLTLDVLETECPVLSRRHWESCEYSDIALMDFGQCKIITYTTQLLKKPHLYGFNCTLSPVPPDLLECKDCPVKIEVLEVTEQHKDIAAKALEKFNREGNHTGYFNVDKVEKTLKMTASREGHILGFSIKETNCSKSARQADQALECDFLDDWHAHVGFCKARVISDPDESDGTDIKCEIYEPWQHIHGHGCRHPHPRHRFGHKHRHRHPKHGCPPPSQFGPEDPKHNASFKEEQQDSHEGPDSPSSSHSKPHHHPHPPHHCPPPPPHDGPHHPHHHPPPHDETNPPPQEELEHPPSAPPPHDEPHSPPLGPPHGPPCHLPPHGPHHHHPPPHHGPHCPHPHHHGPHHHPPPPPHDETNPPPQEEVEHPPSAPPPHDEPHPPPLGPHHGPPCHLPPHGPHHSHPPPHHCPFPPHGPHHHHPPPHHGPHCPPPHRHGPHHHPPPPPPHDETNPPPQEELEHPPSAPPPHDEPHPPPLGPHHGSPCPHGPHPPPHPGQHCPFPPHGPHHHHPPPHHGPHCPPPHRHGPHHHPPHHHHYHRHHCNKTSISGKYFPFHITGAVYRIPVLNQHDSLPSPTANFLELFQRKPHSPSTGEGSPSTGSKEMPEALVFPEHPTQSKSCPGNPKLVLPKILPLLPHSSVAEKSSR
ncbi:PREDICTED: histidine-rich glycoprotein [Apaloderma vittatum]|uniref:histidine-rich glycoprotein n=1 Tax=Apaloderma vittatum TaxID=57397 RepID=UPI0005213EB2|nr:PREDICTED: histidine-rich glycoprotein [Apaloderma vittatum]